MYIDWTKSIYKNIKHHLLGQRKNKKKKEINNGLVKRSSLINFMLHFESSELN